MSPAVLDAPCAPDASPSQLPAVPPEKNRLLRGNNGRFLPSTPGGPGRPLGMKNAESSLLRAAPKLARAYIKKACAGDPTLLKDARTWIMPTDGELNAGSNAAPVLINFGAPVSVPLQVVVSDVPRRDIEANNDSVKLPSNVTDGSLVETQ